MNSDVFQLPIGDEPSKFSQPFQKFGLNGNPFPPSGIDSGVFYADHMREELQRINTWIADVDRATKEGEAVSPLAIYGSLGVGKTHLLKSLEQGLNLRQKSPALRKELGDEGLSRLVLADLFLRYLPFSDDEGVEPGVGLLKRLVHAGRLEGKKDKMLAALRAGSPIKVPFIAACQSDDPDLVLWLSRWLRREYTTSSQRGKIGLSGVLQSEGEAIRAIADLMRLARAADIIQVWYVFIDQLEELWRPDVVSPIRRARFLTDLRHLVDEALEQAPIAIVVAWNTTVDLGLLPHSSAHVQHRIEEDYRALSQRLGTPVDIPPLRPSDVWPFAEKYLAKAGVTKTSSSAELYSALESSVDEVKMNTELAPRKVLQAWRNRAQLIAETQD